MLKEVIAIRENTIERLIAEVNKHYATEKVFDVDYAISGINYCALITREKETEPETIVDQIIESVENVVEAVKEIVTDAEPIVEAVTPVVEKAIKNRKKRG